MEKHETVGVEDPIEQDGQSAHYLYGQQRQEQINLALIELIDSWDREDAAEDPDRLEVEWAEFAAALDADRSSGRRLFP